MCTSSSELLNQPQRNSVSIALRELEITLRHATDDLTSHDQGVLYENKTTISSEALNRIRYETELALQDIASMSERLELKKSEQANTATLLGQIAMHWSNLCDIDVSKLSRYGDVSPELDALLKPALNRLIENTQTIMHILSEDVESNP